MRFFVRRLAVVETGISVSSSSPYAPSGTNPNTWTAILGEEPVDPALVARKYRARRSALISAVSAAILAVLGLVIALYPFVLQTISDRELASESGSVSATVDSWPESQRAGQLKKAHAYNKKLAASGQPVLGEAVDPFFTQSGQSTASDQTDSESAKDKTYQSLLNASGDGIMGSIVIPTISVNLPIFHGSSDAVLARGIGHLYGTSLPVGGRSTQSVLTGHRGLVSALMFTRLDELKIGDDFYIRVMGETLGYKIDRISVILPNDTSQLRVGSGEDRITLMTCTPYGVNTHRLLVSGVRASIPGTIPELRNAPSDAKQLAEHVLAIALLIACLGAVIALVRGRKHPVRRHFSGIRL